VRELLEKTALRMRALAWQEPQHGMANAALRSRPSILFVCKGNINRSLVAEQVLRAGGFTQVESAGLLDMSGRRPSAAAETFVAEELRLPTAALRSRSMNAVMRRGASFEHVVCFERRHVIELERRYPELRGRLRLLSAWAGERGQPPDIADPHGGTEGDYRRCFERIVNVLRLAVGKTDTYSPRMATAAP
jgi:protein-tyrosine-phosphatase